MSLQVKPPEKEKNKSFSPPPSSTPSFSLLPDEIVVNCLARISRAYYPRLSIVSKSFRSLLSSTDLYKARSQLGSTEQCLYVCLWDPSYQFLQWFTLWVNPNQTQLLVPISSFNFTCVSSSIVAVGSEIYVIGGRVDGAPSSAVRVLDCRSHTWRDAPSMNVAREYAVSCVYDGKIYVMGGCKEESWAEVFDTKTQTWERLPDPGTEVRKCVIYRIVENQGKINFGNFYKMYAYDTKQDKWERCENESATFPRMTECVIENVSYRYGSYGQCMCQWYDIKDENWKEVKGLDSLRNKHMRNGGSTGGIRKLVSCGRKLLLIWEGYNRRNPNDMKKIWCAEIGLDKRDGGEVWGNVEWVDVVHTDPTSCCLLHCLAVSV